MNGQEQEDEVFEGASSAEYWMYDSRTGRRFENDPLVYEWQSPYACFNNNPIYFADPQGLEGTSNKGTGDKKGDGTKADNHKQVKKNQRKAKRLAWFQRHGMFKGKRGFNKAPDQKSHKNRIGIAFGKIKGVLRKTFTGAKYTLSLVPQGTWNTEWKQMAHDQTLKSGQKSMVYNLFKEGAMKDAADRLVDTRLSVELEGIYSRTTVDRLNSDREWDPINKNAMLGDGQPANETQSHFIPGMGLIGMKAFYETFIIGKNMAMWQLISTIASHINEGISPAKRAHSAVLRVNNHIIIGDHIKYTLDVRIKGWNKVTNFGKGSQRSKLWRRLYSVNNKWIDK
ncbi:MAG: hypothetical protein Q7W45_07840 [Bacteroidota bacterium]|nr:hypothetical protein [Bacteroidota bacterium]MDP3145995.1 hypothetical protein [Bacteroidota bacterium]